MAKSRGMSYYSDKDRRKARIMNRLKKDARRPNKKEYNHNRHNREYDPEEFDYRGDVCSEPCIGCRCLSEDED